MHFWNHFTQQLCLECVSIWKTTRSRNVTSLLWMCRSQLLHVRALESLDCVFDDFQGHIYITLTLHQCANRRDFVVCTWDNAVLWQNESQHHGQHQPLLAVGCTEQNCVCVLISLALESPIPWTNQTWSAGKESGESFFFFSSLPRWHINEKSRRCRFRHKFHLI